MSCEHIQELILTDYSDGQLSAQKMRAVDNHLMHCLECRTFSQKVKQEIVGPFEQTQLAAPDPFVWRRIQAEIAKGNVAENTKVSTADILANFLSAFRPAAVVVGIFLVLIIAPIVNSHLSQRPSYLTYVMDADSEGSDDVTNGIEQYFL